MKKKVAVLFGGQSTEHEVSRVSAASVLKNIDTSKYEVFPIGITKKGEWFEYTGSTDKIENGEWEKDEFYKSPKGQEVLFNREVDVVFPVMHGLYGEDGTIQGLCKLVGIPCVGPSVLSSSVCMDKVYTKYILEHFNIKQADYVIVNSYEYKKCKEDIINEIESKLGYAVFIKPSNSGSSVGITKAHNRKELENGLDEAMKYDRKILVEEAINAREIEVAVLGNDEPKAAVPGEILPAKEFYDYEAKYQDEESKLLIPAKLSDKDTQKIKNIGIKVYKALDCAGMARVDFLVDKDTTEMYLNEVNTIPGFTSISMYPKLWEKSGKEYSKLIDDLIEFAIDRNNL
ncbi:MULTISPECIES: D-alanine--D-alanine ligase family protein [Clostridium]|uniref:D-alanine--D-alanine ligase family protein n=1 Tax=Clostridium TaxID=1485 RepID=UPI00082577F7|nr:MULTISPECIES: D-alanine--D-alanine ligase family protein [Clostridium]PJI09129.1 D-alanine--D-alanine ligase [Clostridium sp. CT7]